MTKLTSLQVFGNTLVVTDSDGGRYPFYSTGNDMWVGKPINLSPPPPPDPDKPGDGGTKPDPNTPGAGEWMWPFKYSQYVAQSGYLGEMAQFNPRRRNPVTGVVTAHQGLDFGVGGISGKPIPSAHAGVVEISASASAPYFGYGAAILIRHPDGTACLYAHRTQKELNVGDRVSKGQIIGHVGSTGRSTGPHLHWETWEKGNVKVDPRQFMKARGVPEQ